MGEVWKDVVGYEGLYQVSNYGNVRSLNYDKTGKTRLLKLRVLKGRYGSNRTQVTLWKNGQAKNHMVHRLVAMAFIPNPNNLPEVNHKSECTVLNFACVLEWTTHKENCNYGTGRARQIDAVSKPVDQYDRAGNFIRSWKSATEASRQLKISRGNLGECVTGHRKTAGNYVWKLREKE